MIGCQGGVTVSVMDRYEYHLLAEGRRAAQSNSKLSTKVKNPRTDHSQNPKSQLDLILLSRKQFFSRFWEAMEQAPSVSTYIIRLLCWFALIGVRLKIYHPCVRHE